MNFDVFCPVVCRCLCLDVVQDSHNVKRPKSDMEHWPIQIISNNPKNMLTSTIWRPSSQIHPDDLGYIFSLALAPVNPQQTTFSDSGLWDVDLNHVGIKTPSRLTGPQIWSKDPMEDRKKWPVLSFGPPMNRCGIFFLTWGVLDPSQKKPTFVFCWI